MDEDPAYLVAGRRITVAVQVALVTMLNKQLPVEREETTERLKGAATCKAYEASKCMS